MDFEVASGYVGCIEDAVRRSRPAKSIPRVLATLDRSLHHGQRTEAGDLPETVIGHRPRPIAEAEELSELPDRTHVVSQAHCLLPAGTDVIHGLLPGGGVGVEGLVEQLEVHHRVAVGHLRPEQRSDHELTAIRRNLIHTDRSAGKIRIVHGSRTVLLSTHGALGRAAP